MQKTEYRDIRAAADLRPQPSRVALQLAVDVALLSFSLGLLAGPAAWLAVLTLPVLMFRNFSLMHDAVHGVAHPHAGMNRLIGIWSGALTLLPFEAWKQSHLEHHFWSGNIEKDPVMALRRNVPQASRLLLFVLNLGWRSWLPVIGILQNLLFWILSLKTAVQKRPWDTALGLLLPLGVWGSIFSFAAEVGAFAPLVGALSAYYLLVEVVNLPHHLQTPVVRGETRLYAWEQESTARTCIYPRWFARHVVLNFNYHAEHHLFPDAPWYVLDELHGLVRSRSTAVLIEDKNMDWILTNRKVSLIRILESDQERPAAKRSA